MTGPAILLSACAAGANAAGDLLQRVSAHDEEQSARLIAILLRRPRWLLGVVASLLGLVLHVGALSIGELGTVQPVLVAQLPLAVLGSAWVFRRRPARGDLLATALFVVGLALFVACLAPRAGSRLDVPGGTWAIGIGIVSVLIVVPAVLGSRAARDLRGGLLAVAAGAGYGLTGVFFSVAGEAARGGVGALVGTWQTWAALLTGSLSFVLLQHALAAAELVAVEPGLTLVNPLVAVVWGIVVFGEQVRTGPALVGTVAGVALLVAGVVLLARSPALESAPRARTDAGRGTDDPGVAGPVTRQFE